MCNARIGIGIGAEAFLKSSVGDVHSKTFTAKPGTYAAQLVRYTVRCRKFWTAIPILKPAMLQRRSLKD